MATDRDVKKRTIIPHKTLADAMNATMSYETDQGRGLTPLEVALLKIAELEARIAKLEGEPR
jgi:hypothetical protein